MSLNSDALDFLKSVPPISITTASLAGVHMQGFAYAATFVWTCMLIGEKAWKGWRNWRSRKALKP